MRQNKKLGLEAAVAKLTSQPAEWIGFVDRGIVATGYAADLVLFNPVTIQDRASLQNPYQAPTGIESVWVNGEVVVRGGKPTGKKAGKFLRKE